MEKLKIIVCFVISVCSVCAEAQDIHFSQFHISPLLVNPANTGTFIGRFRFSSIYKNQWQSVANPYKSVYAGVDLSVPKKNLGLGITFLNDKSGKSQIGITQGNFLVSYNLKIKGGNNIIAGLQYGVGQRSIKTDNLKWDSQFNGSVYDPSTASGENYYSDSYLYMDISAGIIWNYSVSPSQTKFRNSLGVAIFHANQPQQSFNGNEKMYYKLVAHLNNQFKTGNGYVYILPQILYSKQGPHSELNIGSLIKFLLGEGNGDLIRTNRVDHRYSHPAAYIGGQLRYKDAVTLMGAFEFKKGLMFSAGYDITISKLNAASQLRGGAEVGIMYRGYF